MSKNDIKLFYAELAKSIMNMYHVDEKTAYDAIKVSDMDSIIKKIGEFVYHDVIEYWAKSVWACYQRRTA